MVLVKYIDGYDKQYAIGYDGNVYSFKNGKVKVLVAQHSNGKIQTVVRLCYNGTPKTVCVQRLLAIAFIPNPTSKAHCHIKDKNESNNDIENIQWGDTSSRSRKMKCTYPSPK